MISKIIALSLFVSMSTATLAAEPEKPKTKEVCKEVVKDGKKTKQCKTIKIHKKLEGTKVPDEKKK